MKNIVIYVPEMSVIQAVADPQYCFSAVNQFLTASGKEALFNVTLVGVKKEISLSNGQFSVRTDQLIKEVKNADLIIIPALFGDMQEAIDANKKAIPWIVEHYKNGAEVASLCVGAFLLASTGLLNGKKCSTHWGFQNEFSTLFPEVDLRDGSIVTEEDRMYSSGGAHSYWNLLLHLVEKYTDRETAIITAKYFAIDMDRDSQAAFAMFRGQKGHTDEAIKTAQDYIEKNSSEKITAEELAAVVSVGKRTLERRFKSATNNTILEYTHRVKIECAKRSFENSRKNISEVMLEVGYSDTNAFRSVFKKVTGLTPLEYRNKYNKMAKSNPGSVLPQS